MTSIKLYGSVRIGNVILLGPSGVGKTTLAQEMGLRAGPMEHVFLLSRAEREGEGLDTLVIWLIPTSQPSDVAVHAVAHGARGGRWTFDAVYSKSCLSSLATTLRSTFSLDRA